MNSCGFHRRSKSEEHTVLHSSSFSNSSPLPTPNRRSSSSLRSRILKPVNRLLNWMGSRRKKRSEGGENPVDKRACSSVGIDSPGSENLSQSQESVVHSLSAGDSHSGNMGTEQTGTSYSDGQHAHSLVFGSSDSGVSGDEESIAERNALAAYMSNQSSGQLANLSNLISNLGMKDGDESGILAALTNLCEQLSFVEGHSLTLPMIESLCPILVRLAKHETNPNIMLLAIRAMAYTCDVIPQASVFFVKHEVIPALCQKLTAVEYLDLAEECLRALDKISRYQPLACLQSGVIMASLAYIDFFSTSIQRVAVSIVVNTCRKLPAELPLSLIEALPILCNLLQYEDQQVVERAATCLIKITAQVSISSELLNEICNNGVLNQIVSIIDMNARSTKTALSQTVYNGLIGLLSKLACGSVMAIKTLFELNIIAIMRDILYPSSGLPFITSGGGNYNQIQEVMKLLNELLPGVDRGQDCDAIDSDKKSFLVAHPDILQRLGINILPNLIQVVNMDADMRIDYCCLSVIYKLVIFSEPQLLLELLQNLNISSFLAGVFTRKDPHILLLALKISKTILQKQYDNFMNSFVKDGVFFAIEALLKVELSSQFTFTMTNGALFSNELNQRAAKKEVRACLCYALSTGQPSKNSPCNLKLTSLNDLAKRIKLEFFPKESMYSNQGLTEIHQELKALSSKLIELLTSFEASDDGYSELDEEIQRLLSLILKKLNGSEPVSNFEFIESGVIQALITFLSHGIHMSRVPNNEVITSHLHKVGDRFQTFARLSMFLLDNQSKDWPLLTLVRKLQGALCTLENFPVIFGQPLRLQSSIALVPYNQAISYPTFKVQFLRGEGEENLADYSPNFVTVEPDYSPNLVTVDPFASIKSIEEHLWKYVCTRKNESIESSTQGDIEMELDPANDGVIESSNLSLYLGEQILDLDLTLYQAILNQQWKPDYDSVASTEFWTRAYTITYKTAPCCVGSSMDQSQIMGNQLDAQIYDPSWLSASTIFTMFDPVITSDLNQMSPARDVLYLIKCLECINRNLPSLLFQERDASDDNNMEITNRLPQNGLSVSLKEFVNTRLTEKLEQQMQGPAAVTLGGLPTWWNQLVITCPFLFAFDTRCKYFSLSVTGHPLDLVHGNPRISSDSRNERRRSSIGLPREKFLAIRDNVIESASKMMKQQANRRSSVEVQFGDEVGTGLGPTLEFYTLVSHEFQRSGMGMWRDDVLTQQVGGFVESRYGLFPRPWYCPKDGSQGNLFSEVIQKFVLLGKIVAKALHDGRVLDLHLSKAFYKIILGKNLNLYDIQSFDPELARALQNFEATAQKYLDLTKMSGESLTSETVAGLKTAEIEDLTLDFTLPGYPDYLLDTEKHNEMVTINNLHEYVSLVVDATLNSGIYRQVEAFETGFNQVFPIQYTNVFNEEELERLLCGEQNLIDHPDELLNCIKFDHGYTASSSPILDLLEILQEFDHEQQRAFVQFVTGTPRLPPGGLASLNPKLTIVRKHSDNFVDDELPSAMTCANYLKLPPYSTKAIMKEKLLYAIAEGQGSFHLS